MMSNITAKNTFFTLGYVGIHNGELLPLSVQYLFNTFHWRIWILLNHEGLDILIEKFLDSPILEIVCGVGNFYVFNTELFTELFESLFLKIQVSIMYARLRLTFGTRPGRRLTALPEESSLSV